MHVVILSAAEKWPSVVTVLETFTLQRCTADKRWSAQQSTAVDVGADFAFCTTAPHCRVLTIDVGEALFAFYDCCSSFCSAAEHCPLLLSCVYITTAAAAADFSLLQSTVLCCRAVFTLPLLLLQQTLQENCRLWKQLSRDVQSIETDQSWLVSFIWIWKILKMEDCNVWWNESFGWEANQWEIGIDDGMRPVQR